MGEKDPSAMPNQPEMSETDFIKVVEDALGDNVHPKRIADDIPATERIVQDWTQRKNIPRGKYRRFIAERIEQIRREQNDTGQP